jgi:hypothetical protein
MRELVPTVAVWRGIGPASDLGVASGDQESSIDALAFDDLHGRRHTWADSLAHTYTDGIIVLHRSVRIYERYFGALQPQRPHACFSITKSYAATLAATLIHERTLGANKPAVYYLPEMAGTAYEDATLCQLLDMQIGVDYSEDYADPQAHIRDYSRAGGLRARSLFGQHCSGGVTAAADARCSRTRRIEVRRLQPHRSRLKQASLDQIIDDQIGGFFRRHLRSIDTDFGGFRSFIRTVDPREILELAPAGFLIQPLDVA